MIEFVVIYAQNILEINLISLLKKIACFFVCLKVKSIKYYVKQTFTLFNQKTFLKSFETRLYICKNEF